MKIAVIKPDYGVTGGFESLLDHLCSHLGAQGHLTTNLTVPGRQTPRPIWGQVDASAHWFKHPEFFNYLGMTHDVRLLELDEYDLVLSTQPPSYLAPHKRILALFYHQARIFYELSEPFIQSGLVAGDLHRQASQFVHQVDLAHVKGVTHWLAGSQECADRISHSWPETTSVSLLDAPPLTTAPDSPSRWNAAGPMLCVSRQEWPKRTELALGAAHLLRSDTRTELIGEGGRLNSLGRLDRQFCGATEQEIDQEASLASMTATVPKPSRRRDLIGHRLARGLRSGPQSPVSFLGAVSDHQRDEAYRRASVVVAPAFREDYGLTALEAMVWHRPVVVCSDGGGLVELVHKTGAGLVVEPTAQSIAEGVRRIRHSPDLASELIERAKEVAGTYTWERAYAQLDEALRRV